MDELLFKCVHCTRKLPESEFRVSGIFKKRCKKCREDLLLNGPVNSQAIRDSVKSRLLIQQGYLCAICRKDLRHVAQKEICLDHDHKTKLMRGVICSQCNVGLGMFKDDLNILKFAVTYMLEHKTNPSTIRY